MSLWAGKAASKWGYDVARTCENQLRRLQTRSVVPYLRVKDYEDGGKNVYHPFMPSFGHRGFVGARILKEKGGGLADRQEETLNPSF